MEICSRVVKLLATLTIHPPYLCIWLLERFVPVDFTVETLDCSGIDPSIMGGHYFRVDVQYVVGRPLQERWRFRTFRILLPGMSSLAEQLAAWNQRKSKSRTRNSIVNTCETLTSRTG